MDDREDSRAATLDALTGQILNASFEVHTRLGPGLLESAYEACLAHELEARGIAVERQKTLPVEYKGLAIDAGYRVDLLVERLVVVEVKVVKQVLSVHKAQLLTYLKLGGFPVGLLLNFNVDSLREGIHRLANHCPEQKARGSLGARFRVEGPPPTPEVGVPVRDAPVHAEDAEWCGENLRARFQCRRVVERRPPRSQSRCS